MRFGSVGSPDIFAMHKGVCYGIEVKAEKGRRSDARPGHIGPARGSQHILRRGHPMIHWIEA